VFENADYLIIVRAMYSGLSQWEVAKHARYPEIP